MDSRLLTGTVEMLILEVTAPGPSYGYEIVQMVTGQSNGYFSLKEGSLYPALHRIERRKWIKGYWVQPDQGRRRKYYTLTAEGRKARKVKRNEWSQLSKAVSGVLGVRYDLA